MDNPLQWSQDELKQKTLQTLKELCNKDLQTSSLIEKKALNIESRVSRGFQLIIKQLS